MNLEQLTPDTIERWTLALTTLAGTVGLLGSALASALPKHWAVTQVLARLFADLRNVRQVPPQLPPLPPPRRPPDL